MTLEDHVGDVLSKARQSATASLGAAARAAGLSEAEYAELESTGRSARQPDFAALADLLGLHAKKLEQLAAGWLPAPIDLSQWRELRQITTRGPTMSVNCYMVWDEATREAALFDTGFDAAPIFAVIDEQKLDLKHLFITHTHSDHVAALEPIRNRFSKVRIHTNSKHAPPEQRNRPNDFVHLGNLRITNRDTPGHAEDGVTYVIGNFPEDAPNVAVVGDALFAGSIGGARQLASLAKQKIRDQIFSLPAATLICPGHGPLTTVGEQKEHNPFFG